MRWFQRLRGAVLLRNEPREAPKAEIAVGAKDDGRSTMTYNDKSITFSGDLASYDLQLFALNPLYDFFLPLNEAYGAAEQANICL